MQYHNTNPEPQYSRLSDGHYKAVCVGRDRIKIVWIKKDYDDDNNIAYSIGQWTVTLEHYKQNFTPDMICSKDLYESLISEIKELL